MDRILKEHRKSILTAVVFVLLAVLMWLRQSADSHTEILTREKPGGSVRQEQIICQTGDGVTQELELEIHPQEYSEQETEEYVRQAVSLWEQEYLGENDSEKAIYEALKLPDTMMDGMVTVSYESSEYDIYLPEVYTDRNPLSAGDFAAQRKPGMVSGTGCPGDRKGRTEQSESA